MEKNLAKNTRLCYTYDSLSRVVRKVTENLTTNSSTEDTYTYDAAGNITASEVNSEENSFDYDSGNRLDSYNETSVSYDLDGNMTSAYFDGRSNSLVYDSGNRLISCGGNSYTYNVEDVRIRNVHGGITETYAYDTYGKLTDRTGTTDVIFMYNGRDGVVSDTNGLVYMRARYYSPELCRFVNADIIAGEISNAVTLNRYAYANSNPVSNVDPLGLSADRGSFSVLEDLFIQNIIYFEPLKKNIEFYDDILAFSSPFCESSELIYKIGLKATHSTKKPKRIPQGSWILKNESKISALDDVFGESSNLTKSLKKLENLLISLEILQMVL